MSGYKSDLQRKQLDSGSNNNEKLTMMCRLNQKQCPKTQLTKLSIKTHRADTFILIQIVAINIYLSLLDLAEPTTVTITDGLANSILLSNITPTQNAFEFQPLPATNKTILPYSNQTGTTMIPPMTSISLLLVHNQGASSIKAATAPLVVSTFPTNIDDDNIVISSSEILPDNRHGNHLSNLSNKQQTINEVDLNCSLKDNSDLLDNMYAELDNRRSNGDDSSSNSSHYSNSKHILRVLVVVLFGLVSLSLTIVYTIKFCLCGGRKRQHNMSSLRRPCSLRRDFLIDVDQIERSHFIHSGCHLGSATLEIPTISSQSNRFQSLFRPDFLTPRYRIGDLSAKCGANITQIGCIGNGSDLQSPSLIEGVSNASLGYDLLQAQSQSTSPLGQCQRIAPNVDRLYNYHYCHHHDDGYQYNHTAPSPHPSPLLPLLTTPNCNCPLSDADQFAPVLPSTTATTTITRLAYLPHTTEANASTILDPTQTNDQLDPQPPTYHELFGDNETENVVESQEIDGAIRIGFNEANNESSSSMSSARVIQPSTENQTSSTMIDDSHQQQDQKNLLVKLNLNKTKLLSAGDLMLLSKLIDVPIVVQQQQLLLLQQQQQQHVDANIRQVEMRKQKVANDPL